MSFGETLRNAREQRNLTHSEVAENTHLKVQLVQDLEQEEFKRIAAPIYGRSFVKIYAEFLNLDPAPLVREFMEMYTGKIVAPPLKSKAAERPTSEVARVPSVTPPPAATHSAKHAAPVVAAVPSSSRPLVREVETIEDEEALLAPLDVDAPLSAELPLEAFTPPQTEDELPIFPNRDDDRSMPFFASGEPDLFNQATHAYGRDMDDLHSDETIVPATERLRTFVRSFAARFTRSKGNEVPQAPVVDAHQQRRHARMQAFSEGVHRWGMGNGFSLKNFIPKKQTAWLFGAATTILVSCIVVGVVMVFRLATPVKMAADDAVKGKQPVLIESVCPIPDMYVD